MDRIWCIVKSLPYMLPHNNQIWLPSRLEPKVTSSEPSPSQYFSMQVEPLSIIENLVEQSPVFARKTWPMFSRAFANLKLIICTMRSHKKNTFTVNTITLILLFVGILRSCALYYSLPFDLSFDIMDDIDFMPDDSLSQFPAMASGQEIDESVGTHGIAQTPGGNVMEGVDETGDGCATNVFPQPTQNCLWSQRWTYCRGSKEITEGIY